MTAKARKAASKLLLEGLKPRQKAAVRSDKRRVLVVAGAGSGKTEVMARRVAWWVKVKDVPKDAIVAFTFTERAAEEMKFRIRRQLEALAETDEDTTLGGMYIGTIHGYCLKMLRELRPDDYHNFDVIDDAGRVALVQRAYHGVLGLPGLATELGAGQFATMAYFLKAYDLLNEYNQLDVALAAGPAPHVSSAEREWCRKATLKSKTGKSAVAKAFAVAAARYYAYLRCRRFLDFSTSQSELVRLLQSDAKVLKEMRSQVTHLVVDEVQDINPIQADLIEAVVGTKGTLTAVGDHRQAIFAWRGGRVDVMAEMFEALKKSSNGEVIELEENFRSTDRIIQLSNQWAQSIGRVKSMSSPDMKHGKIDRVDRHPSHVAALAFDSRDDEARWIAERVRMLVQTDGKGAYHDTRDGGSRGLSYSDVTVLVRSSRDARTYMASLEAAGIPAIVRAGPDLFAQPEVLLFTGMLGLAADIDQFWGDPHSASSLPNRIQDVLGCTPDPVSVIRAACQQCQAVGLSLGAGTAGRLVLAATLMKNRISGGNPASAKELGRLQTPDLIAFLKRGGRLRRVFPQTLFQMLLAEAGVAQWDDGSPRGITAMYHLGQLSSLITGIETPGWTSVGDFKYQIIALCQWGAEHARTEEAPLLVQPDAVTISTIHSAKGLEFGAVFLADVCASRFPSSLARRQVDLPFDGRMLSVIDPAHLADNNNHDGERRLMYVALTRAERYLFVTCSGQRRSRFFRGVTDCIRTVGGIVDTPAADVPARLVYRKSSFKRDFRLATSFSDLRYYIECPHDFYLRKVLGFAPTIDQAFGYGRGVHNLMRAVHSNPAEWAKLAGDKPAIRTKLDELVQRGLFYLRYTTGDPLERMRNKAMDIVADYIGAYATELERLQFEPEKEFETFIPEEQVLISGAIDIVRLDDPPRVTLIDFKSGEPESDSAQKLDEEEMRLQISLYGLAAKTELEYDPERGLVRYLDESDPNKRQLDVDLNATALEAARKKVVATAANIRKRQFRVGPKKGKYKGLPSRCACCDFGGFCGIPRVGE